MIIVIDDERTFDFADVHLRTADDAILYFAKLYTDIVYSYKDCSIKELWLDHDLGVGGDIIQFLKFMTATYTDSFFSIIEKIYIHSMNPVGAANALSYAQKINTNAVLALPLLEK